MSKGIDVGGSKSLGESADFFGERFHSVHVLRRHEI